MDAQTWSNLLAWSAQVACVVGLAGLLSWLVRLDSARVRYAYWRIVLAACLALPWLQARTPVPAAEPPVPPASESAMTVLSEVAAAAAVEAGGGPIWLTVLGVVLVAGAALRLTWMGAGFVRLRRLRAAGRPAPAGNHEELQARIGTRAHVRYVPGLAQPATFGVFRPVVLLPDSLRERQPPVQHAVLCHELFHVRRLDWLWLIAEELIRAALWFHPALWWLVSRIQLAREEAVDELTVRATHGRRAYVEALLAFADGAPHHAAAAFSHRNHLFRRIVLVSKEAVMSAPRVVCSCAVMALAIGVGGWFATGVFPLEQRVSAQEPSAAAPGGSPGRTDVRADVGPLEQQARPITPENPIPRRIFAAQAFYPSEALGSGVRARVSLRVTLDSFGNVAEIRRTAVSVAPSPVPRSQELSSAFGEAATEAVRRWQYEPPAEAPIAFDVVFSFSPDAAEATAAQAVGGRAVRAAPGPTAGVPPEFSTPPLRVGGNVREPAKLIDVTPVYPEIAQQARVSGIVIIEATIAPDGRVAYARVLRSIALLDQAALDAVMQWQFTPTLLNGVAVPVLMTVTVNFTLT